MGNCSSPPRPPSLPKIKVSLYGTDIPSKSFLNERASYDGQPTTTMVFCPGSNRFLKELRKLDAQLNKIKKRNLLKHERLKRRQARRSSQSQHESEHQETAWDGHFLAVPNPMCRCGCRCPVTALPCRTTAKFIRTPQTDGLPGIALCRACVEKSGREAAERCNAEARKPDLEYTCRDGSIMYLAFGE